eukprot:284815877_5
MVRHRYLGYGHLPYVYFSVLLEFSMAHPLKAVSAGDFVSQLSGNKLPERHSPLLTIFPSSAGCPRGRGAYHREQSRHSRDESLQRSCLMCQALHQTFCWSCPDIFVKQTFLLLLLLAELSVCHDAVDGMVRFGTFRGIFQSCSKKRQNRKNLVCGICRSEESIDKLRYKPVLPDIC